MYNFIFPAPDLTDIVTGLTMTMLCVPKSMRLLQFTKITWRTAVKGMLVQMARKDPETRDSLKLLKPRRCPV